MPLLTVLAAGNITAVTQEGNREVKASSLEQLYRKLFADYPRTRPVKNHATSIQMEANLKLSQIIELVSSYNIIKL